MADSGPFGLATWAVPKHESAYNATCLVGFFHVKVLGRQLSTSRRPIAYRGASKKLQDATPEQALASDSNSLIGSNHSGFKPHGLFADAGGSWVFSGSCSLGFAVQAG